MSFTAVESSSISAVRYDPANRLMDVKFKSGVTHRYHEVPADAHTKFMGAKSMGKHFHAAIRPNYAHSKLEG